MSASRDKLSLLDLEKDVSGAREEFYSHRAQTESKGHLLEASRTRGTEIADAIRRGEAEVSRLVALLEELAAERIAAGVEALTEHALGIAVLEFARPDHHEAAVTGDRNRRIELIICGRRIDLDFRTQRHAVRTV